MKKFSIPLFILVSFIFSFYSKFVSASPIAGYIVNEQKKLCAFDIVGDENSDRNVGNCKVKVFENVYSGLSPKEVCEFHGYTYESDYTNFCSGRKVGQFGPIKDTSYYMLLPLLSMFLLPLLIGIIVYIITPKKYKRNLRIILIILFILFIALIITGNINLIRVTHIN